VSICAKILRSSILIQEVYSYKEIRTREKIVTFSSSISKRGKLGDTNSNCTQKK
jgi:hypothetical protein